MRVGLICGDGLPVSGLLTTFRNAVCLGVREGLVETPIAADLGYSWRPDKPAFFPDGNPHVDYPDWLTVERAGLCASMPVESLAAELEEIRSAVANPRRVESAALRRRIKHLAQMYSERFLDWLEKHQLDWVIAINMTLSDAVPATQGLHSAAEEWFRRAQHGGVVYWDHDLFKSCAIHDDSQMRVYPEAPNSLTPIPQRNGFTRWIVVSPALAEEATGYPTGLVPDVIPNVLPRVADGELNEPLIQYLRQRRLDPSRTILLNPVRVFRIKGVEIALRFHRALKDRARELGISAPYLLIFGRLDEDPEYASEVVSLSRELALEDDVRFLDGVPLSTYRDATGRWHLDETDLLRLSRFSNGGVIFTPSVPDVETVGLGPALSSVGGLPCAVTGYDAFSGVYGPNLTCVRIGKTLADIRRAAEEFHFVLAHFRTRAPGLMHQLATNKLIVETQFPPEPWICLWRALARECKEIAHSSSQSWESDA